LSSQTAVDTIYLDNLNAVPLKAAMAFYPWCVTRRLRVQAPLLILTGLVKSVETERVAVGRNFALR